VSAQAVNPEDTAAGRLSGLHALMCWKPASAAAAPTTLAITAKRTKNPVAALPIGKQIGENCAGSASPAPASLRWPRASN
jgi:hypothetical protein